MATDDEDKRAKEVIGEASLADLQRWFGLPSFTELEEKGVEAPVVDDPDVIAFRERRARALAAIEPAFLDGLNSRAEKPWSLIKFKPMIDVKVKVDMTMFDTAMAEGLRAIAEPREIQRSEAIEDDLSERTPQALLRDLHRVESFFDKQFELQDMAAAQRMDIVAEVNAAMATSWKLPPLPPLTGANLRQMLGEVREERTQPWADLPRRVNMPNRRVTE